MKLKNKNMNHVDQEPKYFVNALELPTEVLHILSQARQRGVFIDPELDEVPSSLQRINRLAGGGAQLILVAGCEYLLAEAAEPDGKFREENFHFPLSEADVLYLSTVLGISRSDLQLQLQETQQE
jgi:hypothetical protein